MAKGHRDKAFLFFLIDDSDEYLFSLEIIDYPVDEIDTAMICDKSEIDSLNGEEIKRIIGISKTLLCIRKMLA
jgi:hypothetical protein